MPIRVKIFNFLKAHSIIRNVNKMFLKQYDAETHLRGNFALPNNIYNIPALNNHRFYGRRFPAETTND
jgi:hypothetical protein